MKQICLASALGRAGSVRNEDSAQPLPFWTPPAIEFMAAKNGIGAGCPDDVLIGRLIDRSIVAGLCRMAGCGN
ncbi:hypothetical protein DESUT3_10490 [Desulfuromonas versatilis]|uniref:Uncharacterized protein n=1 Tax=Desulfuromonas versatilis TaxID=2802975 RepID=A0ABM9SDK3_9BACT|nr:hypothetical protein [Desulfuromonas versatilis]BCR03980.1 hypothetical protein DESUT3_10490 [Desulfuromonas versatilis]